jgi:hypothetical protein
LQNFLSFSFFLAAYCLAVPEVSLKNFDNCVYILHCRV